MILVDSSVWIDHFRRSNAALVGLLRADRVMVHSMVIAEISLGSLKNRGVILQSLEDLPQATVASHEEVMLMVARQKLYGLGIGYVDAHLLAATRLSDAVLWTRDKRLQEIAHMYGVGF